MRLTGNNKGTSLIELIIAMAVAAIVLSMIMFFISGAAKSFRRTSDEVNLQMEAQTILNQMNNIAMEAKGMEEYVTSEESRYTFQCNGDEYYTFIFAGAENKLYQVQTTGFTEAQTAVYNMQENFLADYITRLIITENSGNKSITIDLRLALGNDNYEIKKTIKMRNAK